NANTGMRCVPGLKPAMLRRYVVRTPSERVVLVRFSSPTTNTPSESDSGPVTRLRGGLVTTSVTSNRSPTVSRGRGATWVVTVERPGAAWVAAGDCAGAINARVSSGVARVVIAIV